MKDVAQLLQGQSRLILWLVSWIAAGFVSPFVAMGYIGISVLVLKSNNRNTEVFLGFLFILILSDSRQPIFEFAKTFKNAYILLLTMFYFLDLKPTSGNNIIKGFIPFFLVAFLSLLESTDAFVGFQKTVSYLLVMLSVPGVFQNLLENRKEQKVLEGVFAFVFLVFFIGFVLRFLSPGMVSLEGRFTGIFGNPNGLGVYSAIMFVFISVIAERFRDEVPRSFTWLIFAMIIISVLLCGSRNALFSILLFIGFRALARVSVALGFVLFIGIVSGYTYLLNNLIEVIISLGLEEFFRIDTLEAGSGRQIAWDFAIEKIEESPYTGNGFNYTESLFKENYNYLSMMGHQGNAHNSYLTLWLDTGLIGLILFIFPFLAFFFRVSGRSVAALPAMYLILFSANFESWLSGSLNPITSMVWMTIAVLSTSRDDLELEDSEQEQLEEEEQVHQLQNGIEEK